MSVDIDELDDEHEQRHDFRRANGAPLVKDTEGKTQRYSRPSGYAKPLDDEHALTNWRIFKAMDGVARSKALQAQVIATKDEDRTEKGRLRELALDRGEANERADQGTGLHAMTVRAEDETDVDFDPGQHGPDLDAYMNCLSQYGLVSEMTEVAFVNDEYRAAGTADRVYRLMFDLTAPSGEILPAGTLVLGDLKTGASLDFSVPAYCVQLALYATGQLYDVIDERRLPTPPINKDWSLLVHMPVGKARCTLHWCSIEIGLYGAWLAFEVKKWQAAWKRGDHDIYEVPKPDLSLPETATQRLAAEGIESVVEMTTDMVPVMMEYCVERIRVIGGHDGARQMMLLQWPDGLPTPKKGGHTPGQVVQMLNMLDEIERKFSLPFIRDPRVDMQLGVHKSMVDRSNEFMLTN